MPIIVEDIHWTNKTMSGKFIVEPINIVTEENTHITTIYVLIEWLNKIIKHLVNGAFIHL